VLRSWGATGKRSFRRGFSSAPRSGLGFFAHGLCLCALCLSSEQLSYGLWVHGFGTSSEKSAISFRTGLHHTDTISVFGVF
jgi:hypothetical protein